MAADLPVASALTDIDRSVGLVLRITDLVGPAAAACAPCTFSGVVAAACAAGTFVGVVAAACAPGTFIGVVAAPCAAGTFVGVVAAACAPCAFIGVVTTACAAGTFIGVVTAACVAARVAATGTVPAITIREGGCCGDGRRDGEQHGKGGFLEVGHKFAPVSGWCMRVCEIFPRMVAFSCDFFPRQLMCVIFSHIMLKMLISVHRAR
jgi:hypothetical protein